MLMTLQVVTGPNGQAEATLQNVQIKIPVYERAMKEYENDIMEMIIINFHVEQPMYTN